MKHEYHYTIQHSFFTYLSIVPLDSEVSNKNMYTKILRA